MQQAVSNAVFNGLSDSLHCAIDTGNESEASLVLDSALESYNSAEITREQLGEIYQDYLRAF